MKKSLLLIFGGCLILSVIAFNAFQNDELSEVEKLRAQHQEFLDNSPFKKNDGLNSKERKQLGLPPNAYFEELWELTLNPNTGRPEPEKLVEIQEMLQNGVQRVPGDAGDNAWVERGPNNVGGRARVVFYDPNDATNLRVFAGSVSGGLWVTDNITTNGGWTQVAGVPGNLNVSCYTIDPNDNDTWYIGTGEQYTAGDAVGNGVYKTTDGGVTWTAVAIPPSGGGDINFNPSNIFLSGIAYVNDIQAWDNGGTTDVFVGVGAHAYGSSSGPTNWLGLQTAGLYRLDGTAMTWSRIDSGMQYTVGSNTFNRIPNDLEISADNTLWMGTIGSPAFGLGGQVYSSTNGTAWTNEYSVTSGNRVELATSATDADKIYILAQTDTTPVMFLSTDAFATAPASITPPNDPDTSVPSNDFTRNQSFYDLIIEVDPSNDDNVYVGGINLHRSDDSGANWSTISHWATFFSTAGSLVHADQHALTFNPGNSNQAVLGHDGGISFASSLSTTGNNLTVTYPVDDDFNVTQFYHMGVAPTAFSANQFLAGAQDNGTPYFSNANPTGPDGQDFDISGGDGAYSFIDQVATDYLIYNYLYNNAISLFDYSIGAYRTIASNSNDEGSFINPMALDSNLDLLYSNGPVGTIYRYEGLTSLLPNPNQAVRASLTNALLTASVTALTVSPHTTTSTDLVVGLVNGTVIRITDADTATPTFTNITGPSFVGSISDVQFGQSTNDIFVTMHNYGVTSVWYSNTGGASWVNKEGDLPDLPVKAIMQNPLNIEEVIIGTDLGVWRTDNFDPTTSAAPNWVQSYNGMSDVKVTDLQLRDDDMVFATTYGRGIFSGQFLSGTLSIEDNLVNSNISIYPKVSDGQITIKAKANLGQASIDIYNLSGQEVYTSELNLNNSSVSIDLGLSSAGMYIVKINGEDYTYTDKIIIR